MDHYVYTEMYESGSGLYYANKNDRLNTRSTPVDLTHKFCRENVRSTKSADMQELCTNVVALTCYKASEWARVEDVEDETEPGFLKPLTVHMHGVETYFHLSLAPGRTKENEFLQLFGCVHRRRDFVEVMSVFGVTDCKIVYKRPYVSAVEGCKFFLKVYTYRYWSRQKFRDLSAILRDAREAREKRRRKKKEGSVAHKRRHKLASVMAARGVDVEEDGESDGEDQGHEDDDEEKKATRAFVKSLGKTRMRKMVDMFSYDELHDAEMTPIKTVIQRRKCMTLGRLSVEKGNLYEDKAFKDDRQNFIHRVHSHDVRFDSEFEMEVKVVYSKLLRELKENREQDPFTPNVNGPGNSVSIFSPCH